MAKKTSSSTPKLMPSKKCPECFVYMPLHAKVCPSCGIRVSGIDKHGKATRATDWKAYLTAGIAIVIFALYIWWAFFLRK